MRVKNASIFIKDVKISTSGCCFRSFRRPNRRRVHQTASQNETGSERADDTQENTETQEDEGAPERSRRRREEVRVIVHVSSLSLSLHYHLKIKWKGRGISVFYREKVIV
jgi:hypothetical protein